MTSHAYNRNRAISVRLSTRPHYQYRPNHSPYRPQKICLKSDTWGRDVFDVHLVSFYEAGCTWRQSLMTNVHPLGKVLPPPPPFPALLVFRVLGRGGGGCVCRSLFTSHSDFGHYRIHTIKDKRRIKYDFNLMFLVLLLRYARVD